MAAAGHSNKEGLQLESHRIPGGQQASLSIPARYSAFPGIVNGGIVSTIFDCHGACARCPAIRRESCYISFLRPALIYSDTHELVD